MRLIYAFLIALLFSSCASLNINNRAQNLQINSIIPKYMKHEDFLSIKEYLTGKETTKNRLIIRSTKGLRAGLYLILTLNEKTSKLPVDTYIMCEVYMPGKLNPDVFEFPLPKINKLPNNKVIFLGITGDDWPYSKDVIPSAWRITLMDSKENKLAEKSSQVWSL
tara:strand:+ start:746 stop:1240 length:495 start_codon:yes stop_codon:yes gene_type:complete